MKLIYRIADKNIRIGSLFSFVHFYCGEYQTDGEPDFEVEITDRDIEAERRTINADFQGGWVEVSAVLELPMTRQESTEHHTAGKKGCSRTYLFP